MTKYPETLYLPNGDHKTLTPIKFETLSPQDLEISALVEKVPVVVDSTISQPHRGMVELSEGFAAKQKTKLLATKPKHIASRLWMCFAIGHR